MKSVFHVLAIALIAGSGAQAQETTTAAVPSGGAISATIQPPAAAKKSKLGGTVYTYNTVGVKSVHNANPESDQYLRLSAKYKLSDSKSVSAFGQFTHTFGTSSTAAGPGRAPKSKVGDAALQYTDSKFVSLPYDWNLAVVLRAYLPTGEESRFVTKKAGAALGILMFEKTIGRLDITHYTFGLANNQTQDYYFDDKGKIKANDDSEIDQYLAFEYHLTPMFSLIDWVGTEHLWARGIPGDGVQRTTNFSNEFGVGLKFSEQFSLQGSVITTTAMDSQNAFTPYQDADTIYRTYLTLAM